MKGAGERFSFWGRNGYDIDPLFGRMVIFRSELVEHAVLPCFNIERMALTIWLHGTGPTVATGDSSSTNSRSVFSFSHSASRPNTVDQEEGEEEEEEDEDEDEENATVTVTKN